MKAPAEFLLQLMNAGNGKFYFTKFHNLFVRFLVHYKERLQAFVCRTEEK